MSKSKKSAVPFLVRQGDVSLVRIAALPASLKPVSREHDRVVLAYGETSGHCHAFADKHSKKFIAGDGAEYFEIHGDNFKCSLPILRRWKNQVLVQHPSAGPLYFNVETVTIIGDMAEIDGEFGLLHHGTLESVTVAQPDHASQAVPAGFYRGAGDKKTVHQREYTPAAIVRVRD